MFTVDLSYVTHYVGRLFSASGDEKTLQ